MDGLGGDQLMPTVKEFATPWTHRTTASAFAFSSLNILQHFGDFTWQPNTQEDTSDVENRGWTHVEE